MKTETRRYSKDIYIILALFLGFCGVHEFYSGHVIRGFLHLTWFFLILWAMIALT